jgi:hypothetical protein
MGAERGGRRPHRVIGRERADLEGDPRGSPNGPSMHCGGYPMVGLPGW